MGSKRDNICLISKFVSWTLEYFQKRRGRYFDASQESEIHSNHLLPNIAEKTTSKHKSSGGRVDIGTSGFLVPVHRITAKNRRTAANTFTPFLYRLETLRAVRDGGEMKRAGLWSEQWPLFCVWELSKCWDPLSWPSPPALNMTCTGEPTSLRGGGEEGRDVWPRWCWRSLVVRCTVQV